MENTGKIESLQLNSLYYKASNCSRFETVNLSASACERIIPSSTCQKESEKRSLIDKQTMLVSMVTCSTSRVSCCRPSSLLLLLMMLTLYIFPFVSLLLSLASDAEK